MFFYSSFPLHCTELHGARPELPRHGPFSRRPSIHPASPRSHATGAPENKKSPRVAGMAVVDSPFREAVKPPLFGELCDGQAIGFDPGEDRLDNVWGKTVQGKDTGDVAGLQAELL